MTNFINLPGDRERAQREERIKIPKVVITKANNLLFQNDEIKIVVHRSAFKRQKRFKFHDANYILKFIELKKGASFPNMVKYAEIVIDALKTVLEEIQTHFRKKNDNYHYQCFLVLSDPSLKVRKYDEYFVYFQVYIHRFYFSYADNELFS